MGQQVISGDAEAAVLRDVRMVLDELLAECRGSGRIVERAQVSEAMGLAIADRSFPDGMALVFDRGQKPAIRLMVLDRLLERLLEQPDVHAAAVSEQIALEERALADERQDRREHQEQFDRLMGRPVQMFPSLRGVEA